MCPAVCLAVSLRGTSKLTRKCWQVSLRCKASLASPGKGQINLRCVVPPTLTSSFQRLTHGRGEEDEKDMRTGKAGGSFSASSVFLFLFCNLSLSALGRFADVIHKKDKKKSYVFFFPKRIQVISSGSKKITICTIME